MEYESIKEITEQYKRRIVEEQKHSLNFGDTRLVKINGNIVGFYVIHFISCRLTIEYCLFEEYQHQGCGTLFVKAVTDLVSQEYYNQSVLYLLIYHKNYASLKAAQNNGYKTKCSDWEFQDLISSETPDYHLYAKENIYYQKHSLKKKPQI